jgi:hypothetical protein
MNVVKFLATGLGDSLSTEQISPKFIFTSIFSLFFFCCFSCVYLYCAHPIITRSRILFSILFMYYSILCHLSLRTEQLYLPYLYFFLFLSKHIKKCIFGGVEHFVF